MAQLLTQLPCTKKGHIVENRVAVWSVERFLQQIWKRIVLGAQQPGVSFVISPILQRRIDGTLQTGKGVIDACKPVKDCVAPVQPLDPRDWKPLDLVEDVGFQELSALVWGEK